MKLLPETYENVKEEFSRRGHHRGHHRGHGQLRPGMRGLAGYWPGYYQPIYQPVYVQQQIAPTCGGSNCNLYWSTKDKQFESIPGSRCTCCSIGSTCRMQKDAPDGVKYNDCCVGMECQNGTCINKN